MSRAYRAIVIWLPNEDGQVKVQQMRCPAGDNASLKFLQDIVGRDAPGHYIEHLCTPDGQIDFWFNEEGKLYGLPINEVATDLLWILWPEFRGWDVLVGNVILTGNRGPETADVPAHVWDAFKGLAQDGIEAGQIVFEEEQ